MSVTLSAPRRTSWVTTLTSGLMAVSVFLAESTLRSPMRSTLCRIWRCRFDSSTTSMSTMPIVPKLAADVDLGQEQVALVAVALLGRQLAGGRPGTALVLPLVEAAGHRHDVLVANVGERLGRERRAHAAGTVDDHRCRLVGDPVLDRALEGAPRDVHSSGDGALLVLVGLPHVEHHRARPLPQLVGGGGVDLADLGLGGGEQLTEARHGATSRRISRQLKSLQTCSTIRPDRLFRRGCPGRVAPGNPIRC